MSGRVICSQQCSLSGDTAGLYYYLLAWPTPRILSHTLSSATAVQSNRGMHVCVCLFEEKRKGGAGTKEALPVSMGEE